MLSFFFLLKQQTYIVFIHIQKLLCCYLPTGTGANSSQEGFSFKIRQTRQSLFNCSPGGAFPRALVCAIGVLGKLILQVTDSFLLRQNRGLQILNFFQ